MGSAFSWFERRDTVTLSWDDLAAIIASSREVCALTGAGVSKESGIPTFRDSSDGIYRRHNVVDVATTLGFSRKPTAIWDMIRDVTKTVDPVPNPGHEALTQLQRAGKLKSIVTQNIDNLHQDSGSVNVVEYHGNIRQAFCKRCGYREDVSKKTIRQTGHYPTCPTCARILKPDVVLFGDPIPSGAARAAKEAVRRCDLLLVVGTSASVSPANALPYAASNAGALVVEVNPSTTGLTGRISDGIVMSSSSGLLQCVTKALNLPPNAKPPLVKTIKQERWC